MEGSFIIRVGWWGGSEEVEVSYIIRVDRWGGREGGSGGYLYH